MKITCENTSPKCYTFGNLAVGDHAVDLCGRLFEVVDFHSNNRERVGTLPKEYNVCIKYLENGDIQDHHSSKLCHRVEITEIKYRII